MKDGSCIGFNDELHMYAERDPVDSQEYLSTSSASASVSPGFSSVLMVKQLHARRKAGARLSQAESDAIAVMDEARHINPDASVLDALRRPLDLA